MIELRYTKSGKRKIHVSKNRRGFEYQDLEFAFGVTVGEEPVMYNLEKIKQDKFAESEVAKMEKSIKEEEKEGDNWFDNLMDNDQMMDGITEEED